MQRLKPRRAISERRWPSWVTERTSPERPTSPTAARSEPMATSFQLEATASSVARSGGGLVQLQAADDVYVCVTARDTHAAALFQHREQQHGAVVVDAVGVAAGVAVA